MPSSPQRVFELENISVTRGKTDILRDINWRVHRGENWTILGGNGSGKTSLLKVLMGYLTATTGEVHMKGRYGALDSGHQKWDAWRQRIGFVSSSIAQLIEPNEQAIEVVMAGKYAMVNYWMQDDSNEAADARAAARILKKVHCEHLKYQPWAFLSQGERQRLLIGRALMSPKMDVLILDEPCAGLDPMARENFLTFLQDLVGNGSFKSLIMVTHHVEEIIPEMTHALVLGGGRALANGTIREALTSKTISKAFGGNLRLVNRQGRYRISFEDESEGSGIVV